MNYAVIENWGYDGERVLPPRFPSIGAAATFLDKKYTPHKAEKLHVAIVKVLSDGSFTDEF